MTFKTCTYAQIATPSGQSLNLEDAPAVYAWYRQLSVDPSLEPEAFVTSVERLVSSQLSAWFSGRLGVLYEVQIRETGGALGAKSLETLRLLAQHPTKRRDLARMLRAISLLQAPLYVGKASRLRSRVRSHVRGASGLAAILNEAGCPLSNCFLRYSYTRDDVPVHDEESSVESSPNGSDLAKLQEDLFTRLAPAAFVRRAG